jgi:nitroreductase
MYDLEQAINDRRSIRMFLPDKQVPRELVDHALELAIRAPSNSNVQPWHLRLVSGAARDRLVAALLDEATSKPPVVPELPELFAHLRRELGAKVYGSMGITRDHTEGRRIAVLRNWEFFRAPLAGVVCMHHDLHYVDGLGVGMFLQTFLLALTARGLGTACRYRSPATPRSSANSSTSPRSTPSCAGWRSAIPSRPFPPIIYGQNVIRSSTTSCSTTPNWRRPSARRPRP